MVSSHQALLFIAPLKEWEVNNPQTNEVVLIAKTKTIAHLKTERTKLNASLIGIIATENQNKVAILGTTCLLDLGPNLGLVELIDR